MSHRLGKAACLRSCFLASGTPGFLEHCSFLGLDRLESARGAGPLVPGEMIELSTNGLQNYSRYEISRLVYADVIGSIQVIGKSNG